MINIHGLGSVNGTYTLSGVTDSTLTLTVANTVTAGTFTKTVNLDGLPATTDPPHLLAAPTDKQRLHVSGISDPTPRPFPQLAPGHTALSAAPTPPPPPPP